MDEHEPTADYWQTNIDRARRMVDEATPEHIKEAIELALASGLPEYFLPSLIGALEGIRHRRERESS